MRVISFLSFGLKKTNGSNNLGRITVYHRGGGVKRLYRLIDFQRNIYNISAKVIGILYDPNRSAFIALICYDNGILSYIISPKGLKIGDTVLSSINGVDTSFLIGNTYLLKHIPVGSLIHNIINFNDNFAKYVRSAGSSAIVLKQFSNGSTLIKLPSNNKILFLNGSKATIGQISNNNFNLIIKKKSRSQ